MRTRVLAGYAREEEEGRAEDKKERQQDTASPYQTMGKMEQEPNLKLDS